MTKYEKARITRLINKFDAAAREHAFKGAAHPDDRAEIEEEYVKARENLREYMARNSVSNVDLADDGDGQEYEAFKKWLFGELGSDVDREVFEAARKAWRAAISYTRRRAAGTGGKSTYAN